MAKFKVSIGKEFAVDGVEVKTVGEIERLADLAERQRAARRHDRMINTVLIMGTIALSGSAIVGMIDGTFNELIAVWAIAAGPMGWAVYPTLQKKDLPSENGKDTN